MILGETVLFMYLILIQVMNQFYRVHLFLCLKYIEEGPPLSGRKEKSIKLKAKASSRNTLRIQDKELLEMTDEGEEISV